jgi:hypothetical protein
VIKIDLGYLYKLIEISYKPTRQYKKNYRKRRLARLRLKGLSMLISTDRIVLFHYYRHSRTHSHRSYRTGALELYYLASQTNYSR